MITLLDVAMPEVSPAVPIVGITLAIIIAFVLLLLLVATAIIVVVIVITSKKKNVQTPQVQPVMSAPAPLANQEPAKEETAVSSNEADSNQTN